MEQEPSSDVESSGTDDDDDRSVSPSALTASSSDDTSDDDDDDDDEGRRGRQHAASQPVDQAAAGSTYAAASRGHHHQQQQQQRSTSARPRPPRHASSSLSSVLRLKIKKRIVSGHHRAPKRDRGTALGGRKLSAGKVRGTTAAGKPTSVEVGSSPEVKRCRPAHWSPVQSSARPADVWLPPTGVRSLMDKVSITDVTANTLTVTVRECTTGEGFFRRADSETPAVPASTSSASADPT